MALNAYRIHCIGHGYFAPGSGFMQTHPGIACELHSSDCEASNSILKGDGVDPEPSLLVAGVGCLAPVNPDISKRLGVIAASLRGPGPR